ncbi:hypothetical protein [Enterococcus faecium]|uniref:hypothetical protein n=1 Tax=Enterococcus faecium TaxID=1352 RepID=UPI0011AFD443|nr:hypothetical protein [Enterococcus faecium]
MTALRLEIEDFRGAVLQQDLQVTGNLRKKKKKPLTRLLLFAFWGAAPIPVSIPILQYRLNQFV